MFKTIFKHKKIKGFTLVELIIVITILAILATISFVSFSGYTSKSRDSSKLVILNKIEKSLYLNKELTKYFPEPDNIYASGGIIGINSDLFKVGYVGDNVTSFLKLSKTPIDSTTSKEYTYGLTNDNKYFQIAVNFENSDYVFFINKAYANNYNTKIIGNFNGLLKFVGTDNKNYIGTLPSLILAEESVYGNKTTFVTKNSNSISDINNLGQVDLSGTGIYLPDTIEEYMYNEIKNDLGIDIDLSVLKSVINGTNIIIPQINSQNSDVDSVYCPEGYILIKGNPLFTYKDGTFGDFCVAKYEMSNSVSLPLQTKNTAWNTEDFNSSSPIQSKTGYYPIVNITQSEAISACKNLGSRYNLITNNQWMTIARDLESNSNNWSSGIVGNGVFKTGISGRSDSLCPNRVGGNTENRNIGTKTGLGDNENCNSYRKLTLTNGGEIWDFIGNVSEFVNHTNDLSEANPLLDNGTLCNQSGAWHDSTIDFSYCKDNIGPLNSGFVSNGTDIGMGHTLIGNAVKTILIRGGRANITYNGLYYSNFQYNDSYSFSGLGFRCVYVP